MNVFEALGEIIDAVGGFFPLLVVFFIARVFRAVRGGVSTINRAQDSINSDSVIVDQPQPKFGQTLVDELSGKGSVQSARSAGGTNDSANQSIQVSRATTGGGRVDVRRRTATPVINPFAKADTSHLILGKDGKLRDDKGVELK